MNKNAYRLLAAAAAATVILSATPAGAATTVKAARGAAQLAAVIARSDKAIEVRIKELQSLSTRIGEMKNLSDAQKSGLNDGLTTQVSGLTTLKAKIDADTDLATAKADEKSITEDYRIYALVIPQGRLMASADRIVTISDILAGTGAKLQARIGEAQAAGKDIAAVTKTLADLSAKLSDAKSLAQKAGSAVLSLAPDKGDKTVAASNKAALASARTDMKTATADLKAARQDIKSIVAAIKAFKLPAPAAATSTASTTAQ